MKKNIDLEEQKRTPYLDAYENYLNKKCVCFDVPSHHRGNIKTELDRIFSHSLISKDLNCPSEMDNLMKPVGPIKDAQKLFAKACGADHAKFLVNGSSSGVLIMFMTVLKANDKVIMPRNVHKSAINALILSGAIPVFISPCIDENTEIATAIPYIEYKKAIDENKDAKAIFIINPTYFGATVNLKKIVSYAHKKGLIVMVDEAHGTHFYFSNKTPISAMEADADLSTLSIHKTGGSLTQSSLLLIKGNRIDMHDVNKTFNILTTTSPSPILLASLDAARKYLVFKGKNAINKAIRLAKVAEERINEIKGFIAHSKNYFKDKECFDYDSTRLCIEIDKLSLSGFEVYRLLIDKYQIQMELAETYVLLCIFTIGSKKEDIDRLINALSDISKKYYNESIVYQDHHYFKNYPQSILRPREAYQAHLKTVSLDDAINCISKEMIMIYPPGIPIIIPGEVFTKEIIDEIKYYKSINATIVSDFSNARLVSIVDPSI